MMLKAFVLFPLLPTFVWALGTQVSGYDNNRMLEIIENFNGSAIEQINLVQITWGKLQADYSKDTGKIDDLSETLNRVICQTERSLTLREHLQAYIIKEQIAEHLEMLSTSGIFREAMTAPEHEKGKWQLSLTNYSQRLHCLFNSNQLTRIFEKVIRRLYTMNTVYPLAVLLRQLYVPNKQESYELMVQSELYLYERYKANGRKQQKFAIYISQLWQQIQKDDFYASLDQDTKRHLLDAVIELLDYL